MLFFFYIISVFFLLGCYEEVANISASRFSAMIIDFVLTIAIEFLYYYIHESFNTIDLFQGF